MQLFLSSLIPRSFRMRLVLVIVISQVLFLGSLFALGSYFIKNTLQEQFDKRIIAFGAQFESSIKTAMISMDAGTLNSVASQAVELPDVVSFSIYLKDRLMVTETSTEKNIVYPLHVSRIISASGQELGRIEFTVSLDGVEFQKKQILYLLIFLCFLEFFLASVLTVIIVRYVGKRSRYLVRGINKYAAGNLDYQYKNIIDDEFGIVAISINEMTYKINEKNKSLFEASQQLEQVSNAKQSFMANMSHEIRTPMNVIIGMADLLVETPLNDEQKNYVEIFNKASLVLLSIVNDILDISKIEEGYIKIVNEEFNLNLMILDVVRICVPLAEAKKLKFDFYIDENVSNGVIGDSFRISQVLINLIGNAIKFTEKGSVVLHVKLNNDKKIKGNLLFSVKDTGMGIPIVHQVSIFLPFIQSDSSVTKKFGGTGLGLTICKMIVDRHCGEIWIANDDTIGSTFLFTIQADFCEISNKKLSTPLETLGYEVLRECKILLVDDSEDNRLLLRAYLKNYLNNLSEQVVEAENGEIAVLKAKEGTFDVILMDIQMPILDGFSATRQIREWENENGLSPVPIIALTAYALKEEREKCLLVGCTLHLSKPIKKIVLLDTLNSLLNS